jgi:hypothetical protein
MSLGPGRALYMLPAFFFDAATLLQNCRDAKVDANGSVYYCEVPELWSTADRQSWPKDQGLLLLR